MNDNSNCPKLNKPNYAPDICKVNNKLCVLLTQPKCDIWENIKVEKNGE